MPETPRNQSRLLVLWPRSAAPDGLVVLPTDLRAFFHTARIIGPDTALFFLTLRALRQRSPLGVRLDDLAWTLEASRRWVRRRLVRLSNIGLIVFHDTGQDLIVAEFTGEMPDPGVFTPEATDVRVRHDIPTHWFLQALPQLGRRAFLAYLYLRSREGADAGGVLIASLVRNAGLWGTLQARFILFRLRRAGLIRWRGRGYTVFDPPPLSAIARMLLRLREMGVIPRTRSGRVIVVALIITPLIAFIFILF